MTAPIELRGVWKIFGKNAAKALESIRDNNLTKIEVLDRFNCVVGVANASFSVSEGEIFCIMGLSGSGKSTLIRHINRLLEPTAGEVFILGEDIIHKTDRELRHLRATKTGMVFQNIALLPHCTVMDNVALPLEVQNYTIRERRRIVLSTLELVELSGWENRFVHELSGGMQQRVGLARAMAADPDILLMDEPFSALDPLIRRQLQDEFLKLAEMTHKTTVFITHDLDEAIRIGHRIAIMKDGALVQIGTAEEIVTNPIDSYVKDFVAGISRLKLVRAETIMEPWDSWNVNNHIDLASAPKVSVDDHLDRLIDVAVGYDGPMVVVGKDHEPIGVVDKSTLLRGIQGGSTA
jgi:glycine betaine/proline transport system ATP-binding protein